MRSVIATETEKLYSPLEFYIHNPREEEANGEYGNYDLYDERYKISVYDASVAANMDAIELAIRRDRDRMDKTRGMAEYLDGSLGEKVVSLFPEVENYGTIMVCAATVMLSEPLTPDEMAELKDWWRGQLSDGWGEGFEQREIKVGHEELYVVPWNSGDDFFLDTEREFYVRLGLEMPETKQAEEPLSPAQMALDEPGVYDEDIDCVETSAYMSMLTDRVNANYTDYIDSLRLDDITDYSAEVATISEAHYYITQRHNFRFSELDYLLQFKDPLRVVADAFDANRDEEHSDIMWTIFHEQGALRRNYPLEKDAADTSEKSAALTRDELLAQIAKKHCRVPTLETRKRDSLDFHEVSVWGLKEALEAAYSAGLTRQRTQARTDAGRDDAGQNRADEKLLKQELFDRLDKNLADYRENMMGASKSELFDLSEDIASRFAAQDFMKTCYDYKTGEVEFLLQFQDPLSLVVENWPVSHELGIMDDIIGDILEDSDSHGHFAKVMDASNPAALEKGRNPAEKQSVIERIRAAEKAPKEPRKDKTDHKRDRDGLER